MVSGASCGRTEPSAQMEHAKTELIVVTASRQTRRYVSSARVASFAETKKGVIEAIGLLLREERDFAAVSLESVAKAAAYPSDLRQPARVATAPAASCV